MITAPIWRGIDEPAGKYSTNGGQTKVANPALSQYRIVFKEFIIPTFIQIEVVPPFHRRYIAEPERVLNARIADTGGFVVPHVGYFMALRPGDLLLGL